MLLFPINILGNELHPCDKVKNLGVIFDNELSLSKHVSSVCRSCFYFIRDFSRIRRHLTRSAAITLANALVTSRLDYCNSLLHSITGKEINRLKRVQNTLCRIISRLPRRAGTSKVMKSLHWLPIPFRINFKLLLITYKALNTNQPPYLSSDLRQFTCQTQTRRTDPDLNLLYVPPFQPKLYKSWTQFYYSFSYAAPHMWNSLPLDVRTAPSVDSFRQRLKTYLFSLAFPP